MTYPDPERKRLNDARLPDDVHFGIHRILQVVSKDDSDSGHRLVNISGIDGYEGLETQTVGTTTFAVRKDLAQWVLERI